MTSAFNILTAYPASAPHPDYREKLMLFGQFEGEWDMDITFYDDSGNVTFNGPGRWDFAWVMDGRVFQDVMTFPDLRDPMAIEPGKRNIGTSLRHYDPKSDSWRIVWIGASSGNLCFLTARKDGDDLLAERNEKGLSLLRWRFSDITENQFHWTGHYSNDDGQTWILEQEMIVTRRA
tara:strand:- start:653 stop:1183 length:531 start_codon:yes stop_codon:yes gene_type:complete